MDKFSVLVVEDEFNTRLWISTIVRSIPEVEVVADASDLAAALDVFNKASPNVIITDIHLPDGNGVDFIKHVRKSGSTATIIVLTGSNVEENSELEYQCRKAGANEFLQKIHNPLPIRNMIANACRLQKRLLRRRKSVTD